MLKFTYTNYKDDTKVRTVTPLSFEYLHSPGFGYAAGWFIVAYDEEKKANRSFRIDDRMMPIQDVTERVYFEDTKPIKEAVDALAAHAATSPEVSSIAAKYEGMGSLAFFEIATDRTRRDQLFKDVKTLAGSALRQDASHG